MKELNLYIDSESSLLSRGGRALYKAANQMLKEQKMDKPFFEPIPNNILEWIDNSDKHCFKHDLMLNTGNARYNMGCIIKMKKVAYLSQKEQKSSWEITLSNFNKDCSELGKHRSLKGAKKKLQDYVENFIKQVRI